MDKAVTKTLKIDGDSHFLPPVNFAEIAKRANVPQSAVEMMCRDASVFSNRQARNAGFKATEAGKRVGATQPPGTAAPGTGSGVIGHGDPAKRVELLPETGFDMQILIPEGIYLGAFGSPAGRDWGPGLRLAMCMSYNNAVAEAQKAYPDQLISCGVVPFGSESMEACIAEAKRAVEDLGVQSLMINSNWRGQNWDSYDLYPFWEVANELDVPFAVHGTPFTCMVHDHIPSNFTLGWERMRRLHISNYLGFGFEYMVNMASLTLGGLLKDFPNLRFTYLEAGGSWLPWAMYTLDRVHGIEPQCSRCDILPSEHIRETCLVMAEPDETVIVDAVNAIGSKNFIIGSDYPHPPSTFPNTTSGIENMKGLSEEAKEDMLGGNLKRMFGL